MHIHGKNKKRKKIIHRFAYFFFSSLIYVNKTLQKPSVFLLYLVHKFNQKVSWIHPIVGMDISEGVFIKILLLISWRRR